MHHELERQLRALRRDLIGLLVVCIVGLVCLFIVAAVR